MAQLRIDADEVLRLDPPPLGHEPVHLLDSPLGVPAVGAHVPLTHGAVRARRRIGAAHDADDMVAHGQPGRSGIDHPAQ